MIPVSVWRALAIFFITQWLSMGAFVVLVAWLLQKRRHAGPLKQDFLAFIFSAAGAIFFGLFLHFGRHYDVVPSGIPYAGQMILMSEFYGISYLVLVIA